jgi:hypothetical protein
MRQMVQDTPRLQWGRLVKPQHLELMSTQEGRWRGLIFASFLGVANATRLDREEVRGRIMPFITGHTPDELQTLLEQAWEVSALPVPMDGETRG